MPEFPLIKNRYSLKSPPISSGGQAVICKATDSNFTGLTLIAKCFRITNEEVRASAEAEKNILAAYNHPTIPRMKDYAIVGSYYFIFMEYVEGKTLTELVKENNLSTVMAHDCLNSLADTLDYCHNHQLCPIIYCDLKPDNVIRTHDGRWVLVDFGSAVHTNNGQGTSRRQGTPGFSAPELVVGSTVYPATDIYSLAALTVYLSRQETPTPQLMDSLNKSLRRALDSNPLRRYKSARQFVRKYLEEGTDNISRIRCNSCGYEYNEVLNTCPRCRLDPHQRNRVVEIPWMLPQTQINVTPLANTLLQRAIDEQRYVDLAWKPLRDYAEKFLEIRGFEKLLSIDRLNIEPYEHQQKTVLKFLNELHCNGILADEVGMGKTIEAGIIISELLQRGLVKKVLIVAPNHLVSQWKEDMNEKMGLRFNESYRNNNLLIVPFHTFRRTNNRTLFENKGFDLVVLDEAHNLITTTGISTGWDNLRVMRRKYTVLITATPIKRRITDIYYLVTLIRPGEFKNFMDFHGRYVNPYDSTKSNNTEQLKRVLRDYVIRNQRKTLTDSWPRKIPYSYVVPERNKITKLYTILNENADSQVIVFIGTPSQQENVSLSLKERYGPRREIFHLTGDRNRKNMTIHKFRHSNKGVLIADRNSSEGRNLQFCHIIVNYDIPRDPIQIEQRIGRVYRIGQKHDVLIYNLAAENSLEKYLLKLYDDQLKLFSLWVGEIYDIIGNLEGNNSIPNKAQALWNQYSSNLREFEKRWSQYVQEILQYKENEASTEIQYEDIYNQLFG